jgi:hypothetical protein
LTSLGVVEGLIKEEKDFSEYDNAKNNLDYLLEDLNITTFSYKNNDLFKPWNS